MYIYIYIYIYTNSDNPHECINGNENVIDIRVGEYFPYFVFYFKGSCCPFIVAELSTLKLNDIALLQSSTYVF